jgi:hypothetical protein
LDYELKIQDPTDPPQSTLLDCLVQELRVEKVTYLRCFFGFLTGSGLRTLVSDLAIDNIFRTAEIDFIVGVDAVTDRAGLAGLEYFSKVNPKFKVRALKNDTGNLIHPKLLHLQRDDGAGTVIVGSNNFTANGLSGNVEAYSILRYGADEVPAFDDWDDFETRWSSLLVEIDDEIREQARRNEHRSRKAKGTVVPAGKGRSLVSTDGILLEVPETQAGDVVETMFVGQLPKAKGRWSQAHISSDIASRFFGYVKGEVLPVYLREAGSTTIEDRTVIYSHTNQNIKIELAAARRAGEYPDDPDRPVVLMRREGADLHRFAYALLMPGDDGYDEMQSLALEKFAGPISQVARVIISRTEVLTRWAACPL